MPRANGGKSQRGWHLVLLNTGIYNSIYSSNSYCFRGKLDCGGGRAEKAGRRQGGLWYVRNAAKANRKPHTPVSNEINASSFSGVRGKSDREGFNQQMRLIVRDFLLHGEQQE